MPSWTGYLAFLLAGVTASAQPFQGQLGRLDAAQLGEGWGRLTPAEMPSLPLEGATVTLLDCEEHCPDPAITDAAGWFSIPDLGMDSARLHFEPPACAEQDTECEPLEPREEVLANGGRTVLGAKWPDGVEDTILRYLPLVANTIYIKREGEIPGLPGAGGAASGSGWSVWVNGRHGWETFREYGTFVHELMHVYEFRLRIACWYQSQEIRDIDGFVLQEDWMRSYEADRRMLEEQGLPLREPAAVELSEYSRARETLAWFAEEYFMPEALVLGWWGRYQICDSSGCRPGNNLNFKTYRELEQYAPNRYAFFERLVFARYLDRKSWERAHPDAAEDWPNMCEPFPPSLGWALDRLPPLPGSSKFSSLGDQHSKFYPEVPPPTKCSIDASY